MQGTLSGMPKTPIKTEQVRLPVSLMDDVRQACGAFDEAPNAYVARAVRELLDREMEEAARRIAQRAAQRAAERAKQSKKGSSK